MKTLPLLALATCVLAGCTAPAQRGSAPAPIVASTGIAMPPVDAATIAVAPASGSLVSGRLAATATADGMRVTGDIGGLAPGSTHGLHVHEKGDCSAADASSAGPHFNPAGRAHGGPASATHHAGDLPNITAGADGVAHVDLQISGLTLGGAGATNILGRALVVHAQGDDYASQPAGNSGTRIACGVVRAGR